MTAADRITQLLNEYPASGKAHRWYQVKRSGDLRPIATPNKELKLWLKHMNKALTKQFNAWPDFMHGGIKKRSYVSYARPHVGKPCVITLDIKRCFDSITEKEVADALRQHLGLAPEVCDRLASVLCFRSRVPQGFSTSNFLCNLYLLTPLTDLHKEFRRQGMHLNNYVDDLAISGAISAPDAIINQIAIVLSRANLKMSNAKKEVMPSSRQQIVCGLIVNKRLSLTRKLKLKLLSDVARGRMTSSSAGGWVANLKNVDPSFQRRFHEFAVKKGLIK